MTWSWLERERERQMAELEEILAELVARGLVLECKGNDTQTRYDVNPWKVSEIRALLKERMREGPYSLESSLCALSWGVVRLHRDVDTKRNHGGCIRGLGAGDKDDIR
ncbi:MAG: hypothetical protein AB7P69_14020 [Candidatus Binatia bacterium]